MNDNEERVKKEIVETVRAHPEGLTIMDLSRIIGSHRQTITKYVLVLEATDVIHRRRVGSATLHYLKERFVESVKEQEILDKIKKRLEKKKK